LKKQYLERIQNLKPGNKDRLLLIFKKHSQADLKQFLEEGQLYNGK
jgi:hypothetical protein